MADIRLSVDSMRKHFGGVRAVDGISFSLEGNELIGLIGPNGSGKTTTVNSISGLLRIDGGSIHLGGERIDHLPPFRRARMGIGRTFQVPRIFRRMTVLENLQVPALAMGREDPRSIDRRAHEVMEFLLIKHLIHEHAKNLSGGQHKLLELGRVLMLDPDVIFLDEPFSGVHQKLTRQIHDHIKEINQQGKAFVIIDHDMDSIFTLSQRVIVMNGGQMIADGDPETVRENEAVIEAYLGDHPGGADDEPGSEGAHSQVGPN